MALSFKKLTCMDMEVTRMEQHQAKMDHAVYLQLSIYAHRFYGVLL